MDEKNQDWKTSGESEFDFMREKIKERPLNKKKLLRRMLITVSMAFLFGLIACVTVLVLEPVISNWLYPEDSPEVITFPSEEEEILPEDMVYDDEELYQGDEEETQFVPMQSMVIDELNIYRQTYKRLQELTNGVSRCLTTVTGVVSDTDWMNNMYESRGQTTGIIVGNNKKECLILTNIAPLEEVELIRVTFYDNSQVDAQIKMKDTNIGLAVLSVPISDMLPSTLEKIAVANLGSSNYMALKGSPIIALGSPTGTNGSVIYGMVTSQGNSIDTVDSKYKLLTTDIYGSSYSSGVLVNLQGEIVGIIDQNYNDVEMQNMISAIGISELKKTIERMSNGKRQAYLGIHGSDVTKEANRELNVPFGAYVSGIEMDSPAMLAGIQSGDVITEINGRSITNFDDCILTLSELAPEAITQFTVMRQNQNEYKEMEIEVTLGELQ